MKRRQILEDLEQRVKEMLAGDKLSGENKGATTLDYIRWAIEDIELNSDKE
jgi:hypothetical protein